MAGIKRDMTTVNAHFQQGLKKAPNLPLLYTTAGDIYYDKNNCEEAIKHFEKLQSLAPPRAFMGRSEDPEKREKFRIFQKHASRFYESMEKMEACKEKLY